MNITICLERNAKGWITSSRSLAPSRSFPSLRSVLCASASPLCSTLSLCRKPSFPWYSAFNTLTSFRSVLETYDCSALSLKKKQGTMASADFLQFVVTAGFGFSYLPPARPPRVRATTFLPRNRHIYRTGFRQHWTLCWMAHSSIPVRPTM